MKKNTIQKFYIIFFILILGDIISIIIGYYHSPDVSGWWPILLLLLSIIYAIYAGLFILIDKINSKSIKHVIVHHIILATILTILNILFYTINIDWYAVNVHGKQLTFFQSVIRSDITNYSLFLLSLIIHLVYVYISKIKK